MSRMPSSHEPGTWMKAGKDLPYRRCRWCHQTIRRGERYRAAGWDLTWYVRKWEHEGCRPSLRLVDQAGTQGAPIDMGTATCADQPQGRDGIETKGAEDP